VTFIRAFDNSGTEMSPGIPETMIEFNTNN
jgi:hypothetical protein